LKSSRFLAITLAFVLVTGFGTPAFAEDANEANNKALALASQTIATPAVAPDHIEVGEAGQLLPTAQVIGGSGPLDSVTGFIDEGDVDLYQICVTGNGDLTIDALSLPDSDQDDLDMNLHTFNSAGNPLGADDDSSPFQSLGARVTISVTPGTYFFAVGDNNLEAEDAQGNRIQDNDSGIQIPNGVLAQWKISVQRDGPYEILLSGANDITNCGVVGGEFLPIDSTALLLAVASTPAAWLSSLALVALGIGAYVFTRNPNNMKNIKVILRDYLDRF